MNKGYFESDFFDVEVDPHINLYLPPHSQRKPSCDEISELFPPTATAVVSTSAPMCPPTPKPRKPSSESSAARKQRKPREDSKTEGVQRGHWTADQNKRYHWFLELHSGHFLQKHLRRTDKIFKAMEVFIGSRQAEQCRSHHQKMEKKHGPFQLILLHLRTAHYSSADALPLHQDLQAHGLSLAHPLLSWAELQGAELGERSEAESEKSEKSVHTEEVGETFIDPFVEMQGEDDHFLTGLIL